MAMGSGLLALAMAMVAADGPACPPVETTTYNVRVLTMDGLDWRTSSYTRLQPVAHQGTSTIWTADRALAASLADRAKGSSPCHTIMAVGEAALTKVDAVNYIAAMDRVADGPMNQSSAIAFMPRPEQLEERFSIKVSGRKIDQGVLTKIALEETHVDVIHDVPQSETLVPPAARSSKNASEFGQEVRDVILTAIPTIPQATSITSSVQIPEVTQARVEGEWLIPNDGVLLVSLGVKTAADDKGMAVVRERVAVIEACAGSNFPVVPKPMAEVGSPVPEALSKLGSPALPSRSIPQAVDPDGKISDLPPLPEALASNDLDRIKPEPNQPSPQAPILSAPEADAALARTGYDAVPPAPMRPTSTSGSNPEGRLLLLTQVLDALARAGVAVDFDVEVESFTSPKPACEKCDGDTTFCPADARAMKTGEVAGGLRLAPERSLQIGVSMDDPSNGRVFDTVANLKEALKSPGRTETTLIPLDGKISLEIKATVVPSSTDKTRTADKKVEDPAAKR